VFVQNEAQNLLAKRFVHGNRIRDFKPNTSVAKKSKIVQDENSRSAAAGSPLTQEKSNKKASSKRPTSAKKSPASAKKQTTAKTKGTKGSKGAAIEPTDEEIQIRAYFIAERRHRLELVGDADTDWLEAKRQLLAELKPR
jgi:Protein of unknown function (DUF2934)